MRRTHRANHDHVNRSLLHTNNSHLNNIHNVLHQNGDGTGNSPGNMLDSVASSLNDMKTHTNLTQSRLNNIQNHLTQNGDGSGTSHGVMLDSCASSLNTIESNSTLTASRLNNVQNKLSENTDGTGDTLGQLVVSNNTKLDDIETLLTSINNGAHSHQNLYSNGSLLLNTLSTTIDMSNHRNLSLFGKTTTSSGTLYLALSSDDSNYYIAPNLSTYVQVINGIYYFGNNFANIGARYVRVLSTTTLSALYMTASMKN